MTTLCGIEIPEATAFEYWKLSQRIAEGDIPRYLVDIVAQGRYEDTVAQAFYWAWVFGNVDAGNILMTGVWVGHPPMPDKFREENQELLFALPAPYSAEVDPTQRYSPRGDGALEWTESITVDGWRAGKPTGEHEVVGPLCCSLEIGLTRGVTTMNHIACEGVLARWPYESNLLYLLWARRDWLDSLRSTT